jgi:hypothetical protein
MEDFQANNDSTMGAGNQNIMSLANSGDNTSE